MAFEKFAGPDTKIRHAYTDNSEEFKKAFRELGVDHDTSTPHRPQTNGVAERAVRRVKEGTSCCQIQSGFSHEWWKWAVYCYCFLRCIVDKLWGNETAYKKRFGKYFDGPFITYGAQIRYLPDKDDQRAHKFSDKMFPGIFVGYAQESGGDWNGDLLLADWENIESVEHVSQILVKRFKASEVEVVLRDGKFIYPLAEGDLCQPGPKPRNLRRKKSREPEEKDEDTEARGHSSEKEEFDDTQKASEEIEPDYWFLNNDVII